MISQSDSFTLRVRGASHYGIPDGQPYDVQLVCWNDSTQLPLPKSLPPVWDCPDGQTCP